MARHHRRWTDLSTGQRASFLCAAAVQVALAATAWTDLARRPPEGVRGRKPLWAMAIGVDFAGPVAYLLFGRAHGQDRACAVAVPEPVIDAEAPDTPAREGVGAG